MNKIILIQQVTLTIPQILTMRIKKLHRCVIIPKHEEVKNALYFCSQHHGWQKHTTYRYQWKASMNITIPSALKLLKIQTKATSVWPSLYLNEESIWKWISHKDFPSKIQVINIRIPSPESQPTLVRVAEGQTDSKKWHSPMEHLQGHPSELAKSKLL